MKISSLILLGLLLTACSGGDAKPAADSTPTPTATAAAGPSAFVAFMRQADYGAKNWATAPEASILEVGNDTCDAIGDVPFAKAVSVYVTPEPAGMTVAEGEEVVRAAVANLCPDKAAYLP